MKKIVCLLFLVMLICICLGVSAFATEPVELTVSNVTASQGDTVKVSVSISESTFATYGMQIVYDQEVLKLVSIEAGPRSQGLVSANPKTGIVGMINFQNTSGSGVLFTATFEVLTSTAGKYAVSVNVDNVSQADLTSLDVKTKSGAVTVSCKHTYSAWEQTKEATCSKKGEEKRSCTNCGNTETRSIPVKSHTYGEWEQTLAPTCAEKGRETRTCTACGTTDSRSIAVLTHTFGEWVETKAPTCMKNGEETRTCTACNAVDIRVTDKSSVHTYGTWTKTKEATCTEAGEETRTCVCGATETRVAGELKGHTFGEWKLTEAPTCSKKGEGVRTCSQCDATERRDIETIDHKWSWIIDREPTDKKEGIKHEACVHCSATRNMNTPIEKLESESNLWLWILLLLAALAAMGVTGYFVFKRKFV